MVARGSFPWFSWACLSLWWHFLWWASCTSLLRRVDRAKASVGEQSRAWPLPTLWHHWCVGGKKKREREIVPLAKLLSRQPFNFGPTPQVREWCRAEAGLHAPSVGGPACLHRHLLPEDLLHGRSRIGQLRGNAGACPSHLPNAPPRVAPCLSFVWWVAAPAVCVYLPSCSLREGCNLIMCVLLHLPMNARGRRRTTSGSGCPKPSLSCLFVVLPLLTGAARAWWLRELLLDLSLLERSVAPEGSRIRLGVVSREAELGCLLLLLLLFFFLSFASHSCQ